uniref:Transglycosylase SLT domain-containing protein n=1 Tax=mine drainage metagenome TaxID=410659 RepID=E6QP65_9ZZZZ
MAGIGTILSQFADELLHHGQAGATIPGVGSIHATATPAPGLHVPTPLGPQIAAQKAQTSIATPAVPANLSALIAGSIRPTAVPGTSSPVGSSPATVAPPHPLPGATPSVQRVTAAPGAPTLSPGVDYDQAAINADQAYGAFVKGEKPFVQPQYKAPNKYLEYGSALLGLMFPGSPFSHAMSGLGQGLLQGSQQKYARNEQAAEIGYKNQLAKAAQLENESKITGDIAARHDDMIMRSQYYASLAKARLASARASLENAATHAQQFGLNVQKFGEKDAHDQAMIGILTQRNLITQSDAVSNQGVRMKVAELDAATREQGFKNNAVLHQAALAANAAKAKMDAALRYYSSSAFTGTPAQAQAAIAAATTEFSTTVGAAYEGAASEISALGNAEIATNPAPVGTGGVPGVAGGGTTINLNLGGGTSTGNPLLDAILGKTLGATPGANPAAPAAGSPTTGKQWGTGVPEPVLGNLANLVGQHWNQYQTEQQVEQALLSDPRTAAAISAPQMQHLLGVWANAKHTHHPGVSSTETPHKAAPQEYLGPGETHQGAQTAQGLVHFIEGLPGEIMHLGNTKLGEPLTPHASPHPSQHVSEAEPIGPQPTVGDVIQHAAKATGFGPEGIPLIAAVLQNESGGNPNALSKTGAIGYMQLEPGTARELGVNPHDPTQNILGGATYLKQMIDKFHSIPLAIAAYNAGPGAVVKYRGIPPFPETRAYVQNVMATYLGFLHAPAG